MGVDEAVNGRHADDSLAHSNLDNLYTLWRLFGASDCAVAANAGGKIWHSHSWPHRVWCEAPSVQALAALRALPVADARLLQLPHWGAGIDAANALAQQQCAPAFQQTAMYLPARDGNLLASVAPSALRLVAVDSQDLLKRWVALAAAAFGYDIALAPVAALLNVPAAELLLAYLGDEPVATALWFRTGSVLGLHQFGVLPAAQGQGIARQFLTALLQPRYVRDADLLVLQASQAGRPLYARAGFQAQFTISNFWVSELPNRR